MTDTETSETARVVTVRNKLRSSEPRMLVAIAPTLSIWSSSSEGGRFAYWLSGDSFHHLQYYPSSEDEF